MNRPTREEFIEASKGRKPLEVAELLGLSPRQVYDRRRLYGMVKKAPRPVPKEDESLVWELYEAGLSPKEIGEKWDTDGQEISRIIYRIKKREGYYERSTPRE